MSDIAAFIGAKTTDSAPVREWVQRFKTSESSTCTASTSEITKLHLLLEEGGRNMMTAAQMVDILFNIYADAADKNDLDDALYAMRTT